MYDLPIAKRGKVYLGFGISLKGVYLEVYDIVAQGTVYEKLAVSPFIRCRLKPKYRKELDELAGACSHHEVGSKREGTIVLSKRKSIYWSVEQPAEQTEEESLKAFLLPGSDHDKAIILLTIGVKTPKWFKSRQILLRWSELNGKLGNPLKYFKLVM